MTTATEPTAGKAEASTRQNRCSWCGEVFDGPFTLFFLTNGAGPFHRPPCADAYKADKAARLPRRGARVTPRGLRCRACGDPLEFSTSRALGVCVFCDPPLHAKYAHADADGRARIVAELARATQVLP